MRRYTASIQQPFRAELFPLELDQLRFHRSQTSPLYIPESTQALPALTLDHRKEALGTDRDSVPEPLALQCVQANVSLHAENAELKEENLCLNELLEQTEAEYDNVRQERDRAAQDVEERDDEIRRLNYDLNRKHGVSPSLESTEPLPPAEVDSIGEAIEQAHRWLSHLAIHEKVGRPRLSSSQSGWPNWVWQVFRFLNDYAKTDPDCDPYTWAKRGESQFYGGGRHTLAMRESKTVEMRNKKRNKPGPDNRWFPIDTAVDPSGYAAMFSHFKNGTKSGSQMLRIYFHDDAKGVTGKMHIGYIGDHLDTETTN